MESHRFTAIRTRNSADTFRDKEYYFDAIGLYQQVIKDCSNIDYRNHNDYFFSAETAHSLANCYFNLGMYKQAAQYYLEGIKQLYQAQYASFKLEDKDFREILGLYIDLSDTYIEQSDQAASLAAFELAKLAFTFIEKKTDDELKLNTCDQFRLHYERELSSEFYLMTSKFEVHGQILKEEDQTNQACKKLDAMEIDESSIFDLKQLSNLTVTQVAQTQVTKSFPFVLAFPINGNDDTNYRELANKFIELASNKYSANSKDPTVIDALRDAIDTLNCISQKNALDNSLINQCKAQIEAMKPPSVLMAGMYRIQPSQTPSTTVTDTNNDCTWDSRMEM